MKKKILLTTLLFITLLLIFICFYWQQKQKETFPIKLLDTKIPKNAYKIKIREDFFVQPDFFDPKTTKFYKEKNERFYRAEGISMMINGWLKENENKIELDKPFDLNYYGFYQASSHDYVIEITKNGKRQALYSHVITFDLSENKRYLFLVNAIKVPNKKYQFKRRIIDIKTNKSIDLPTNMDCVSDLGFWSGNRLITYFNMNDLYPDHYEGTKLTAIGIWSPQGKLLYTLSATLFWSAGANYYLYDQIGLLPDDPEIFYAYSHMLDGSLHEEDSCALFLQDLKNQKRYRKIKIIDFEKGNPYCPTVEFDFKDFKFNSKKVKFKVDANISWPSPLWGIALDISYQHLTPQEKTCLETCRKMALVKTQ